jgi:hypothetical protein
MDSFSVDELFPRYVGRLRMTGWPSGVRTCEQRVMELVVMALFEMFGETGPD